MRFDADHAHDYLSRMYAETPGRISICHTKPGGGSMAYAAFDTVGPAVDWAAAVDEQARPEGIYHRQTTLVEPQEMVGKRGSAEDSYALPNLWADLDYGLVGHSPNPKGLPLPPTALDALKMIAPLPAPSVLVHSGGGWYPQWLLDEPLLITDANRAEVTDLSRRWQLVIQATGAEWGWSYGAGVYDLPRVLRVSGSVNRKDGLERRCEVVERSDRRYSYEDLLAAVADAGSPAQPGPSAAPRWETASTGDGPFDLLNLHVGWGDILEPLGWTQVAPPDSQTLEAWCRPGGTHPVSAKVLKAQPHVLVNFSEESGLPTGAGNKLTKGKVYALLNHDGDQTAAARALLNGAAHDLPAAFGAAVTAASARRSAAKNEVSGEVLPRQSYIDPKDGLLARSLLRDVQRLGPLAAGGDGRVWAYHEGVWHPDGDRIIINRAKNLMGEQFRPSYAHTVQVMIMSEAPFITDRPVTQYLNLANGLLDWRTGVLHDHSAQVPSTAQLPVRWSPDATCPVIDRFLLEVVDDPQVVDLLGEVAGYCCYADQPLHKAILLLGEGRNGKGTYLRILGRLLGEQNIAVVPPQELDGNRFMIAELYGKLANLIGDVEPKTFNETAKFKSATGGDRLTGERKYAQPFGFINRALIVAAFNQIPKSADTTTGFFSRWIVVPFPHKYADPAPDGTVAADSRVIDHSLEPRMSTTAEQEGFLVFAVAGLRRLMASGRFTKAAAVIQAETRFRNEADPVRAFLAQSVVVHSDAWISRNWLHSQFQRFAEDGKHGGLAARPFLTRVIEVHEELFGFPAKQTKRDGQRGWSGIRLRLDADAEIDDAA